MTTLTIRLPDDTASRFIPSRHATAGAVSGKLSAPRGRGGGRATRPTGHKASVVVNDKGKPTVSQYADFNGLHLGYDSRGRLTNLTSTGRNAHLKSVN